jgi:hypothetical protein
VTTMRSSRTCSSASAAPMMAGSVSGGIFDLSSRGMGGSDSRIAH